MFNWKVFRHDFAVAMVILTGLSIAIALFYGLAVFCETLPFPVGIIVLIMVASSSLGAFIAMLGGFAAASKKSKPTDVGNC